MKVSRGILWLLLVVLISPSAFARTWFVRRDGGTRYSSKVTTGQCDGKADAAYPGSGTNRHCAFNDFRYMWDDDSGQVGAGAWVIAGGDTVVVRGCKALPTQINPANPTCRIGWDINTGGGPTNRWCWGVGNITCYNPPIPAGTAANHTKILGGCAYESYNCTAVNTYPLASNNLTQLFGGMGLLWIFNMGSTSYVDIQGIEFTTHNGSCTYGGAPPFPRSCNNSPPLDDYSQNGLLFDNKSSNVSLQDVYVHGFNASGFYGPIGGPIALTRVFSGFNGFAGWNFQDSGNNANGAGSSITASYVAMIGNGCYEQYPIKNPAFPARACYDDSSGGFGDAWSGQDTGMDTFVCDHCVVAYNTKDGFVGPHVNIHALTITKSQAYGNMGAQWKWINAPGGTVTFSNNLTIGNCARFSDATHPIPGASQSFALSSKLPGAYLSDYCRAGGNTVAFNSQENSHVLFANNTFVGDSDTVFLLGCGPANNNRNGKCGATSFVFTNNIFLGYYVKGGEAPGLYYIDDRSIKVTSSHNIEFGDRSGFGVSCRGDNICTDPRLVNQPPQQAWTNQSFLDNFTFYPKSDSPAVGHGLPVNGVATDFFGVARPNPPSIGAVEPRRAQ